MTDSVVTAQDDVIACLLSEREAAIRGEELAGGLFAAVEEVAELLDGYGYRFLSDGSQLEPLLEFIASEPHGGPLWLRMRGSPQVKAFITEAFNTRLALLPLDAPEPSPAIT